MVKNPNPTQTTPPGTKKFSKQTPYVFSTRRENEKRENEKRENEKMGSRLFSIREVEKQKRPVGFFLTDLSKNQIDPFWTHGVLNIR